MNSVNSNKSDQGGMEPCEITLHGHREVPTMILWGEHDPLIPVAHAYSAHQNMQGSRLEIFQQAGHFPYRDNPRRFVDVLIDFIQTTAPAQADEQR